MLLNAFGTATVNENVCAELLLSSLEGNRNRLSGPDGLMKEGPLLLLRPNKERRKLWLRPSGPDDRAANGEGTSKTAPPSSWVRVRRHN